MRRVVTSVLSTVAVVVAGLVVGPTGPASAGSVPITLAGFTDLAVDEAHDNVLIASGDATSDLTVLSLAGEPRTTIGGMAGATDIRLSADGSVFWVALSSQKAIGVVDAATLDVTKIPLGSSVCPTSVVEESDVLWFTYTNCTDSFGGLGSVRLSDSTVTTALAPDGLTFADRVEASPGLPGKLVARSSGTLTVLDVSAGPTTTPTSGPSATTDARDFAVTPDGLEVISTDYSPYRHVGFSTADMTERTIYPDDAYPTAVAVRGDGLVAAGIDASYNSDIWLYQEGSAQLFRSYEVGTNGRYENLDLRGLAFGATDVYGIKKTWDGTGTWKWGFVRITPKRATSMTLTPSAGTIDYDQTAKVTVKLSRPSQRVSVYVTPYGGSKRLLKTATANASGYVTVSLPLRVRTMFSVTYAGDSEYDAVGRSATVYVRAAASAQVTKVVGTSGSYKLVRYRSKPSILGTVKPSHAGQCVRFQLQEPVSGGWGHTQTTPCFKLSSASQSYIRFDVGWPVGSRARSRMIWGGDSTNAAKTSSWVYVKFVK